ncbi:MDR family MFS transporter [Galactobacter caseinivorans]|uniref:MFS transporter n=1 Tax=Galactobacter caseinivorans TaxID=2676123 RepID=A0A496PHH3_9MICC|nr:MDR family MFS transporter [Galactobacter caseinivorans]RKW69910.1 MFS transporter [Galactobacter caseinivorans]
MSSALPQAAPKDDRLPPAIKTALTVLIAATFVVILNETIMGVALPKLMVDLKIDAVQGQWLTTGFMLTMAVVIPVTGLILQVLRTRIVFLIAMGLFTAGTALAAAAPDFYLLLVARVIQAGGTAIMLPLLITTAMTFVPAARRGRVMGLISIVISVAPAVGPTISGLILHVLPWRWLFIIVLPIAAAALILGALVLKDIGETRRVRVDMLSVLLSVLGFGGLVYGLSAIGAAASGTAQVSPAVPLSIGVAALAVFIWRQTRLQRTDEALLDLRPFTVRTFTVSIILVVVLSAAFFGVLILLPLYVQSVLGWDTLGAGLMLLPGGVVMGVSSEIVGRLYDRFGPSPLVIPGSLVVSGALWIMTTFGVDTQTWMIVATHVLLSIGLAFMFTPLMTNALGALPKSQYSYGSAILSTLQQVAGGAGTALLITVMTLASSKSLASGSALVPATADGIHAALLVAAFLSLGVVALSFLVKRAPAEEEEAEGIKSAPVDISH